MWFRNQGDGFGTRVMGSEWATVSGRASVLTTSSRHGGLPKCRRRGSETAVSGLSTGASCALIRHLGSRGPEPRGRPRAPRTETSPRTRNPAPHPKPRTAPRNQDVGFKARVGLDAPFARPGPPKCRRRGSETAVSALSTGASCALRRHLGRRGPEPRGRSRASPRNPRPNRRENVRR